MSTLGNEYKNSVAPALMEKFGTIDKIMHASIEELCLVDGIGKELAEKIQIYFKEKI